MTSFFASQSLCAMACVLCLFSCAGNSELLTTDAPSESEHDETGNLQVHIECLDLSESSALSTQNDELILLLYPNLDQASAPLLAKSFSVDEAVMEHNFSILTDSTEMGDVVLFLIEVDSNKNLEQIEPIIRLYRKELAMAAIGGNNDLIRNLLGDDDLLGIQHLGSENDMIGEFEIQGIHLFDKYHYRIKIAR